MESEIFKISNVQKKAGHYSKADWQTSIYSVWGSGLPTSTKIAILDAAMDTLDKNCVAFFYLFIYLE